MLTGGMALLFSPSSFSSMSSSLSTLAITVNPFSRLHKACVRLSSKTFRGLQVSVPIILNKRCTVIVKASPDVGGTSPPDGELPSEEIVPVENLPLESKLQLKLEQKTRMKLAKKIRLRRKRLVRKRRLRKKGRWPPSKMKKNKNV